MDGVWRRPIGAASPAVAIATLAMIMGVRSSRRWQNPATFAQVIGAGEGNRTLDIQLGKLSFYH
jgi:hypothetical protein